MSDEPTIGGLDSATNPLDNVIVVLDHPQNVINIAGVIRAMKNMGISRLRVVNPAEWDAWRIDGIAHRTTDIVESTGHFDTLEEALADCVWVVGTSARSRTAIRNYTRPHAVAPNLIARAADGPVAVLFGREDRGLANDALDLCNEIAVIPTSPEYSSLNLAQAFLIVAYEIFTAAASAEELDPNSLPQGRRATGPATREDLEQTFGALHRSLERIQFFKGARLPEAVMRTIRTVLARADMDSREAKLFAAIGYETLHYIDRRQEPEAKARTADSSHAEADKGVGEN